MRENWKYSTIGESCNINYGTRVVRKRDGGSIYDVYGGGGATFKMDTYNREDCLVVSRFAMSPQCTRFVSGKFFLNDSGLTLSPKKDTGLSQAFINTILLANNDNIYKYGRGSAQRNLKVDEFCTMPISYPKSLTEQERIVALLDDQFAKIDALKANAASQLQAAKDLFQSALKEMLTPKEGWDEKTLGDIGEFTRGGNFTKSDFVSEGIPCIHYGQVHMHFGVTTEKTLSYLPIDFPKVKYAKQGDLIIAITSEDDEGSCKCTAWLGNENVAVGGHIAVYHHSLDPKFMSYYFRSPKFQTEKLAFTHGFKVVEIKPSDIAKIPIIYPKDKEEQRKIVSRLDAISEKVKALQANYDQTITLCNDLKQSLLKSIFA